MKDDRIFRPKEAAQYLGISPSTLYDYVKIGRLDKPLKIGKRASGFRLSSLEKFLSSTAS
ncbi:AlpA Predicted transcriptional regulator [uncultured Caudovirales phage]|uniref:AlpA Predicted transcriptional regulator n=1 Tax=uncultured Caudovirales phage TaxID=2100421 RepID=A0A6J5M7K2_9CAUD|nr:AlpA Predicted transcriptional regulator [uncultured Caudovirales phage]